MNKQENSVNYQFTPDKVLRYKFGAAGNAEAGIFVEIDVKVAVEESYGTMVLMGQIIEVLLTRRKQPTC